MIEYFQIVRSAIRDGQAAGDFRPELNEKIAANCFFGAIDEMVTSWVLAENDYPLANTADSVANVILLGMQK
jgi:TetR/AcrR family fatty acid metabolism transcriptional regulator